MARTVRGSGTLPVGAQVSNPRPGTAEKRQRILESAMEIFATRGYNNGSLREIAHRAGISQAGVVHHFGSKDQLLIAMLEYRDDADVAELEGRHIPDGPALFEHLVRTVELNTLRPGVLQLYAVLSADSVTDGHPAQQYFRSRYVGLRTILVSALRDVVPGADDTRLSTAASSIVATMDGLQLQWLLAPNAVDMAASVRLVITAVIAELTGTPTPR